MADYYKILDVEKGATDEAIKKSYRKLVVAGRCLKNRATPEPLDFTKRPRPTRKENQNACSAAW